MWLIVYQLPSDDGSMAIGDISIRVRRRQEDLYLYYVKKLTKTDGC